MKTMRDTTNMTVRCARGDKRTPKGESATATGAAATTAATAAAEATDSPTGAYCTATADSSRPARNGARRHRPAPRQPPTFTDPASAARPGTGSNLAVAARL